MSESQAIIFGCAGKSAKLGAAGSWIAGAAFAATGANAAPTATAAAAAVTWNLVATVVMSPHTFVRK